jgi:hypothetical protein
MLGKIAGIQIGGKKGNKKGEKEAEEINFAELKLDKEVGKGLFSIFRFLILK